MHIEHQSSWQSINPIKHSTYVSINNDLPNSKVLKFSSVKKVNMYILSIRNVKENSNYRLEIDTLGFHAMIPLQVFKSLLHPRCKQGLSIKFYTINCKFQQLNKINIQIQACTHENGKVNHSLTLTHFFWISTLSKRIVKSSNIHST